MGKKCCAKAAEGHGCGCGTKEQIRRLLKNPIGFPMVTDEQSANKILLLTYPLFMQNTNRATMTEMMSQSENAIVVAIHNL